MAPILSLNIKVSQYPVREHHAVTHPLPASRFPVAALVAAVFTSSLTRSFFEVCISGMQLTELEVVKRSPIIVSFIWLVY
jgi:hypothetical protein